MDREFSRFTVSKKQEERVKNGHPWVYADEIEEDDLTCENGSIVDVFGRKGNYLGSGLYSSLSKIRIRILSNNANEKFGDDFFSRRVSYAVAYRQDVMGEEFSACRLIHGESDGLPGVTVDCYNDVLVTEIASYGMEQRKDVLYHALVDELKKYGVTIRGIYERNESPLRSHEGLKQYKGWYGDYSGDTREEITECGLKYLVDIENGQKTGFFLDQKYNRVAVRKLAHGKTVLDCCTHTGSFAMNAAYGNAKSVTALDISETALDMAEKNAALNNLDEKISFIQGDVFEKLAEYRNKHTYFDLIILDPPAFTKSRKTIGNARNGYLEINTMAMHLLKRGSYLVTCSCSHFFSRDDFYAMLQAAAKDAGVSFRIVEERHAAPDHPVLAGVDETEYLKFFLLQIV